MRAPEWKHSLDITPELAARLDEVLNLCPTIPSFDAIRAAVRGIDSDVDALLVAIRVGAIRYRASFDVSGSRKSTEAPKDLDERINVRKAAELLECTPHNIRLQINLNHLAGGKDAFGYWTTRAAVDLYGKRTRPR